MLKKTLVRRRFNMIDALFIFTGGVIAGSGSVWLGLAWVGIGYLAASAAEALWG